LKKLNGQVVDTKTYPFSTFIDAKAYRENTSIGLGTGQDQTGGYIDALNISAAGKSTGDLATAAILIYATPDKVSIKSEVMSTATNFNVAVYQTIACGSMPGTNAIAIGRPVLLNPQVYGAGKVKPTLFDFGKGVFLRY
jgi:hypothetical protein